MYLGIDYGKKRIGLALGEIIPKGAGVVENKNSNQVLEEIKNICEENFVVKIIIGLPTLPSGDEGCLADEVKNFAKEIQEKLKIETVLEPEGFTSVAAQEFLNQNNQKYSKAEGKVDELSAVLILEQYLNKTNKDKTWSEIADGK